MVRLYSVVSVHSFRPAGLDSIRIEGRGHACSASISELELFDSKHTSNSASATETDRDAHA